MSLKQLKPYTPSTRFQTYPDYKSHLLGSQSVPRQLVFGIKKFAGRNSDGRICVRHQGGGSKRRYRKIAFIRRLVDSVGTVEGIQYDPNRTAFIALVRYQNGSRNYQIATEGVQVGQQLHLGDEVDIKAGNSLPLKKIPAGTQIHSVELLPGAGARLARSAGASATLVGKVERFAQVRLPSGEVRLVPDACFATIGVVSNSDHMNVSLGKAGRSRWKGIRPSVRGVAMNPVDHPMGGGEGKSSGGRHPCTPWGKPTKGYKTRGRKASDRLIISKRK